MPSVSQAQNRYWHAVEEGDAPGNKKVAADFLAADHGRKIGNLPQHVGKAKLNLKPKKKRGAK